MTLDLDAIRREAEEGLAIAENATLGPFVPWRDSERERGYSVCTVDRDGLGDVDIADTLTEIDAVFFADARTRAPNAYRAVIELCAEVADLERIAKREAAYRVAAENEVERLDQKLHATENMNAELAEACSNAIEEIDAWKAKYVAEKTMRQNAEQNEAEARNELEHVTPVVEAAIVWSDRFNPRTDPDEDEQAICDAVAQLYPPDDWRAKSEAVRDMLRRRRARSQ